jgi:hypothetical protein
MKDEIAYCGIKCHRCIKFEGKHAENARKMLASINESGLDKWQAHDPKDEDFSYPDVKKGLVWFEKSMRCAGCHAGGGNPGCAIRECGRAKGVENCGLCAEMPCEKVRKFRDEMGIDVAKNLTA